MNLDDRCAKCGACNTVCPAHQVTGRESLAARGKLHLLHKITASKGSTAYADIISKCLLCGACLDECPRQIDTPSLIMRARAELPRRWGRQSFLKYFAPRTLSRSKLLEVVIDAGKAAKNLFERLPKDSGLRLRLRFLDETHWQLLETAAATDSFIDTHTAEGSPQEPSEMSYFTGCLANYLYPDIGTATATLVKELKGSALDVPPLQTCCGLTTASSGSLKEAKRIAKQNIATFEKNTQPILTSCASCFSHLKSYPELLGDESDWHARALAFTERLCEFSTYFNEQLTGLQEASFSQKNVGSQTERKRIAYHDPCHLRFGLKIIDAPRQLINKMGCLELVELPHGPQCCGQGGLFRLLHPELSQKIMDQLLTDFTSLEADLAVTTCSGCLLHWQEGLTRSGSNAMVKHLSVMLAEHYEANKHI